MSTEMRRLIETAQTLYESESALGEGMFNPQDSITDQISDLLAQNKTVISRLPGTTGWVTKVHNDNTVTIEEKYPRGHRSKETVDLRTFGNLSLQGNIDHFDLIKK